MVWIKRLNTADSGDATHVGGDHWDTLDEYHDNVDIGAPVKINTTTRFRSSKFVLRDSDDTHDYIFNTGNLSANVTINYPTGWPTSVTPAVVEADNLFTNLQTIKRTSASLLKLYRNTANIADTADLLFDLNDSGANDTTYGRIRAEIVDPTDTSEDGSLKFSTLKAGVLNTGMIINENGQVFITQDPTLTDALYLYRARNTNNDQLDLNFDANNSIDARLTYADIRATIINNTSTAEDGRLAFNVMKSGTKTEIVRIEGDEGKLMTVADVYDAFTIYRPNNTVNDTPAGMTFRKNNSSGSIVDLGFIYCNMSVNTAGAEDSDLTFYLRRGGASIPSVKFNGQGDIELYDSSTASDIYLGLFTYKGKDSAGNIQDFGNFYAFKDDATSGSEDLNFGFDMEVAGTIRNTHWLSRGSIGVQDDGMTGAWHYQKTNNIQTNDKTQYWSNGTAYIPCYLDSNGGNSTIINNSSSEQTIYSNTTPQHSMNQNGFMRMTIHGYILQNQATGTTFTFRAKFGGVTMWDDVTISFAQSATKIPFTIVVTVWNKGVENAQGMAGFVMINDTSGAGSGIGDITDDESSGGFGCFDSEGNDGTRSTDTGTQSFSVTAQASVASGSVQLVRRHVDLLLVTAG